ncbi:MAG: CotH kinase family protein, partial [Cytophagaceae bacterium]|nr:CotH kinase family protein [Cytophagaceae bacterium]
MNGKFHNLLFIILFLSALGSPAQVIINEVSSNNQSYYPDNDGDFEDWIELYNPSAGAINLLNYKLSDSVGMPARWTFPNVSIPANGYLTVYASGKNRTDMTDHWEMIVRDNDSWKYTVPVAGTPATWIDRTFNDAAWTTGTGSIGYGGIGETTTVPAGTLSVFMRRTFNIVDSAAIKEMMLKLDYDDGFIAYLNGVEIARNNVTGTPPAYNALATTSFFTAGTPATFSVSPSVFKPILRNGSNVLSISVHNSSAGSTDLLMRAFLMVGIGNTSTNYFATPGWFTAPPAGQVYLHTNFSLNAGSGETVTLANPSNTIINSVFVPALQANNTYGRFPNGGASFSLLNPPTPNANNGTSTSYTGYLNATVTFSLAPGFYSGTQTVSCTCSDATAQIRYTTDGSKPIATSALYSAALSVNTTRVLRAACFKAGYLTKNIETNSYFISDPGITIPVFSISTHPNNFFQNDTGIYVMGPNADPATPYFGANFWQDWEREVHIEYFDKTGIHKMEQDCGIKIFGGWSRANAMKSMRLIPDEKYGSKKIKYAFFSEKPNVTEFTGLHLRDGGNDFNYTHLRDQTNHRTLQSQQIVLGNATNIDRAAYEPVIVFINGQYWGVHHLRERYNNGYLEGNFGVDKDDYEMLEMDGDVMKKDNAHWTNMYNFIMANDMSITANYNTVKGWLDINNFADYFIAQTYHTNWDWPNNNVKYWRETPNGKWRYLYYDTDFSFDMFGFAPPTLNELTNVINSTGGNNRTGLPNPHGPMLKKLLNNTEFKNYFVNRYADLMNTIYLPANYKAVFDGLKSQLDPEMARHFAKWPQNAGSVAGWNSNCNAIRTYMDARIANARNHVQSQFSLAAQVNVTLQTNPAGAGVIKISTITPNSLPWSGVYFNGVPVNIVAIANPGYTFVNWSSSAVTVPTPTNNSITLNITANNTFTANFTTTTNIPKITINEINYNSDSAYNAGNWIELYNYGNAAIDISGWVLKDENDFNSFVIPNGTTLGAGQYLVLVQDVTKFTARHPTVTNYVGAFPFSLSNSGELIRLFDNIGRLYLSMTYDDVPPWPLNADGKGSTLELKNPNGNLNDGNNWFDGCREGSPGRAFTACPCAAVDLGADQVLCSSGGNYTINTGLSAHPNRKFRWYYNGVLLPMTTPNMTASAAGDYYVVVDSMGCIKTDAITLRSDLTFTLGSDQMLCDPVTTTLDSKLSGPGITYVWRKNGTVITGETSPTLFVKTSGTYQLTASATGCTNKVDDIIINSGAATPVDGSRCGAGTVNLSVTGPGTYEWYTVPTGGAPVFTGTAYTTPSLSATTTYYVKDASFFSGTVGPPNPNAIGAPVWTNSDWNPAGNAYKLRFDVLSPLVLDAVTIYAAGAQNVTIRVLQPDKTTVRFTKTVSISSAGANRIPLGFQFTAGDVKNGYYIDLVGTTGMLDMNGGGTVTYPYTAAGKIRITDGNASWGTVTNWYFYLYNWEYSSGPGPCLRVPVVATINCMVTATITPAGATTFCQGGSVVLNANTGAGYTYQWKRGGTDISGATSASYTATIAGSYTVVVIVGGNSATSSPVVVTVNPLPTPSAAGPDQNVCASIATLAGNTPSVGTGAWTIISGTATVTTSSSPTSGVTGLVAGNATLRWTISNSCGSSADDVVITRTAAPTSALAGPDQSICGTTATLAGNTPATGTGLWTVVSGAATITTPASPTSGITALGAGANTLRWTISNSPCAASTDDVIITGYTAPTFSNAGADQNVCAATTTLAGNTPATGTGLWTVVSGAATITTATSPTSGITALGMGVNVLRW